MEAPGLTFDDAFDVLIGHEGGFQRDPKDPGNWTGGAVGQGELAGTKFGLSAASYPRVDIKNMTVERAKLLYLHDFWKMMHLDQLPEAIRFDVFDCAVNSGIKTAARILQRAVGEVEDGYIGPRTRAACALLDPQTLDKRLSGARLLYLTELPTWPSYGRGWTKRIAKNLLRD